MSRNAYGENIMHVCSFSFHARPSKSRDELYAAQKTNRFLGFRPHKRELKNPGHRTTLSIKTLAPHLHTKTYPWNISSSKEI